MNLRSPLRLSLSVGFLLAAPALMGARGDGCAAASKSAAPDVSGTWDIAYSAELGVEVNLGGAVYHETLPPQGGQVTIDHNGIPLTFNLDCAREDIVCPSEGWPETVTIEQRNAEYEHQMIVTIPQQKCSGQMVEPAPEACGAGTINPDCDKVCDGEVTVRESEAFGVIGEAGKSFRLYLGGGIASNGYNCAMLGYSLADAALETEGEDTDEWRATAMTDGVVTVGYAGGCLFAGNVDADPELEGVILGASLKFTTGFTGARAD